MRDPGAFSARSVRLLARVLLALFFRRVEVTGVENLPATGGGLLIAWHPNGMIDPALLLTAFPGRVVFGARHGLFRWPILGGLLRATAVPIHRRQDLPAGGDEAAARSANDSSLGALAEAVVAGSFAVLFPEGDSHDEPRPIELRTGAARLWLDAARRDPGAPLPHVVPVGLHYDRKRFFRSRALVAFHPPLPLAPEPLPGDERDTARHLTARFAEALDQTALATDDWEEHHLMHRLRRLMRAERAARAGATPGPADMRERRLGFERVWTAYRERRAADAERIEALRDRLRAYDRALRALGLDDHELDRNREPLHGRMVVAFAFQRLVVDALLPPLALIGLIANLPPALALGVLARLGAKRKKDVASIKLLAGAVLFPATWAALGILAARGEGALADLFPTLPRLPWATGVLAFLLSAAGGVLVLVYGRISRRWGRALWVRVRRRLAFARVARLLDERAALFDAAQSIAAPVPLPGQVDSAGRIRPT